MKALFVCTQLAPTLETMVVSILFQKSDSAEFVPVDLRQDDIDSQVDGLEPLSTILADFALCCGFSDHLVDAQGIHLALITPKTAAIIPKIIMQHDVDSSMIEARVVPQGFCYVVNL